VIRREYRWFITAAMGNPAFSRPELQPSRVG
jgi:hypothetical protein